MTHHCHVGLLVTPTTPPCLLHHHHPAAAVALAPLPRRCRLEPGTHQPNSTCITPPPTEAMHDDNVSIYDGDDTGHAYAVQQQQQQWIRIKRGNEAKRGGTRGGDANEAATPCRRHYDDSVYNGGHNTYQRRRRAQHIPRHVPTTTTHTACTATCTNDNDNDAHSTYRDTYQRQRRTQHVPRHVPVTTTTMRMAHTATRTDDNDDMHGMYHDTYDVNGSTHDGHDNTYIRWPRRP
ncbi:LOW QUALITY PROTEIN: hypothetical protein CVT25_007098 [Psilocybe cyanescens]|uniref:Uncharacterized protein n=1 Tax=Psilocybe cyanescens TaxID=93625 RepID=A0A409WDG4_PSICY|nr:LOW QUALITY PROTEIN: hypothetical protein CVT25_007098 [Psilocybe cyanescens]